MSHPSVRPYDVVIMGGGIAGSWQARHLMLKIPGIRVAVVDPRSEEEVAEVKKIGESMVEVAALFAYKELGLYDYLVENHPPKNGLNYHWPRRRDETGTIDDYFSVWNNRNPPVASFQLHRGRFESDIRRMNIEMGADVIRARVVDMDLTEGDALHGVTIEDPDGQQRTLQARHVVDAAGRAFLIGRRKQNLLRDPEDLFGLDNGSAWIRVEGVDRTLFHDGYDPDGAATSHYYGTNHFFGDGHWVWMIPIDCEQQTVSIGVMFHKDRIEPRSLCTQEAFLAFLEKNHNLLYRLAQSGSPVDFRFKTRVAHRSKTMFSPDNWYVVGDAAAFGDAFYSLGTTTIAFAVESVTEIIRAKLGQEPDAARKQDAFNQFNLWYAKLMVHSYRYHSRQLGHASVMSWRVYFENMWWFGMQVPIYIGKYHLDPDVILDRILPNCELCFVHELYQDFNTLIDRGDVNIGFMDCYLGDQLALGYNTPHHHEGFLKNGQFEAGVSDVWLSFAQTYFYTALYLLKFRWKAFGWEGLTRRSTLTQVPRLLFQSAKSRLASGVHRLTRWWRGVPDNSIVAQLRQDFRDYRHEPGIIPWTRGIPAPREGGAPELRKVPAAQPE